MILSQNIQRVIIIIYLIAYQILITIVYYIFNFDLRINVLTYLFGQYLYCIVLTIIYGCDKLQHIPNSVEA